jgi:MtfA peptidase
LNLLPKHQYRRILPEHSLATMNSAIKSSAELSKFYRDSIRAARVRTIIMSVLALGFFGLLAYFSQKPVLYGIAILAVSFITIFHLRYHKNTYNRLAVFRVDFPEAWRAVLEKRSVFFQNLNSVKKNLFEKRIQLFLSEKRVEGIDTDIDDEIRVLVAASAIIPTFAFPAFNYPQLTEVLIYPASFSQKFEIGGGNRAEQNIEGMVGNRYMNHSLLLSKPSLLAGFNGRPGEENVGIHEFVHLLDREDGETDGVPERLMNHGYSLPWLKLIKEETDRIRKGRSDINPYAITNNAEFLAVVSAYFFNDPEDFHQKHQELYTYLSAFYGQEIS